MGKKDDYQFDYLDDAKRFADQINGALFGGKQVVRPEELEAAEPQMVSTISEPGAGRGTGNRDCGRFLRPCDMRGQGKAERDYGRFCSEKISARPTFIVKRKDFVIM